MVEEPVHVHVALESPGTWLLTFISSALKERPHRRSSGKIMYFNPAVQRLCPVSFTQAPFEVISEKQALLRVIHHSLLGHLSLKETDSALEVPGLFH